ncbi:MAG: M23 family metallopeptidase, partial [Aeromonas sp.]
MFRSALAIGQSLMGKLVFAGSAVVMGLAMPVSAAAASSAAATTSDNFRISPEDIESNKTPLGVSDPEFRSLHDGWGRIKGVSKKVDVSIPSINPVEVMRMTSQFGYRTDPFQGRRKNHKGLDIAGPIGTPIYATADGIIGRAQWVSGYGKYIEVEHGNAIQTRYGHLSAMNVVSGQRVKQGDIIGFMGSTGRSTGSHLHYEVRIAGEPVNPNSFLAPIAPAP